MKLYFDPNIIEQIKSMPIKEAIIECNALIILGELLTEENLNKVRELQKELIHEYSKRNLQ